MKLTLDIETLKNSSNIELLAKQMVEGFITGLHKSPYHGFSVEFAEHSLYNYGESTKNIDWKVYAKTDRLYTKRFEEETNLRCHIVLDTSSSMYYPSKNHGKIKFSILAAAALAFLLQKQRDAIGLFTFDEEIRFQSEVKSTSTHVHNLLVRLQQEFEKQPNQNGTATADVLHRIAGQIPRRSLVIIFSDLLSSTEDMDNVFSALQHLKHNKHEVLLFHVNDKNTEVEFDFEDRPYKFKDLETGEIVKLTPTDIKINYQNQMKKFYKDVFLKCSQLKIDLIDANIHDGFDQILSTYLAKRSKMK
ncbi:MAG: DUF58 domain-containing protein [Reichenbachiella sp.]